MYVKAKSWHVYQFTTRGGLKKTRCGLFLPADAPESAVLQMDEKSCESCLRYHALDESRS